MALHAEGGLVVGGRNLAYKGPAGEETLVLVDNDVASSAQVGFSDLVASPKGQVYAGTLGSRPDANGHVARGGGLYLIDLDGSRRAMVAAPQDKAHQWPSGPRRMAAIDITPIPASEMVLWYRVEADGSLTGKHAFATLEQGIPDGLAVAGDGSVWVAGCFAGSVFVYEPSGALRCTIPIPIDIVTNVCFGGPELRDVYITTGALDPSKKEATRSPSGR